MVEALVAGLCCVVPNIETLREVGKDARAYFYEPGSINSFERVVSELIDQNFSMDLEKSQVLKKYSLENSCARHVGVYEDLLVSKLR